MNFNSKYTNFKKEGVVNLWICIKKGKCEKKKESKMRNKIKTEHVRAYHGVWEFKDELP